MKPMLKSRYVGWMAIRPLKFGDKTFEPGEKVPQKHLESMRDPEVLVRTNRLAAVAKDMNKVPRMLRKDVTEAEEMFYKITTPLLARNIGPHIQNVTFKPEEWDEPTEESEEGEGSEVPTADPSTESEESAGEPETESSDVPEQSQEEVTNEEQSEEEQSGE